MTFYLSGRDINMSPKERVEGALKGELIDKIPFTVYERMIPQCEVERALRNKGLCIINRLYRVYRSVSPNVREKSIHFVKDGKPYIRKIIETPRGNLSCTYIDKIVEQDTYWQVEMMFKSPKDYDAIEFMIKDKRYLPDYEPFIRAQRWMGNDIFLRADMPYSPLQEIIYNIMGIETFSIEWIERREQVMRLYDALIKDRRKIYPIVAKSPAVVVKYGGNVSPEVLGKERFIKYILPHYNECAEFLHQDGKIVGSHFDANNRLWAKEIANSKLDYIEAFTPEPDSDLTVAEARKVWPDKSLWINFPPSVLLKEKLSIEKMTKRILKEAAPGYKFLIGITENVPANRWQESFHIIMKTINRFGRLPMS